MYKDLKAFCVYELKKIINMNDLMLSLNDDVSKDKKDELLKINGSYQSILEKVESDEYDNIDLANLLSTLIHGNRINETFVINQYNKLSTKLDDLI